MTKCPYCEYEWEYKPTKHTKNYYACCPQCRKYIPLRQENPEN